MVRCAVYFPGAVMKPGQGERLLEAARLMYEGMAGEMYAIKGTCKRLYHHPGCRRLGEFVDIAVDQVVPDTPMRPTITARIPAALTMFDAPHFMGNLYGPAVMVLLRTTVTDVVCATCNHASEELHVVALMDTYPVRRAITYTELLSTLVAGGHLHVRSATAISTAINTLIGSVRGVDYHPCDTNLCHHGLSGSSNADVQRGLPTFITKTQAMACTEDTHSIVGKLVAVFGIAQLQSAFAMDEADMRRVWRTANKSHFFVYDGPGVTWITGIPKRSRISLAVLCYANMPMHQRPGFAEYARDLYYKLDELSFCVAFDTPYIRFSNPPTLHPYLDDARVVLQKKVEHICASGPRMVLVVAFHIPSQIRSIVMDYPECHVVCPNQALKKWASDAVYPRQVWTLGESASFQKSWSFLFLWADMYGIQQWNECLELGRPTDPEHDNNRLIFVGSAFGVHPVAIPRPETYPSVGYGVGHVFAQMLQRPDFQKRTRILYDSVDTPAYRICRAAHAAHVGKSLADFASVFEANTIEATTQTPGFTPAFYPCASTKHSYDKGTYAKAGERAYHIQDVGDTIWHRPRAPGTHLHALCMCWSHMARFCGHENRYASNLLYPSDVYPGRFTQRFPCHSSRGQPVVRMSMHFLVPLTNKKFPSLNVFQYTGAPVENMHILMPPDGASLLELARICSHAGTGTIHVHYSSRMRVVSLGADAASQPLYI